jgi:hypothetical protein
LVCGEDARAQAGYGRDTIIPMDFIDAKGAAKELADEAAQTIVPALGSVLGPVLQQAVDSLIDELAGLTITISISRKSA